MMIVWKRVNVHTLVIKSSDVLDYHKLSRDVYKLIMMYMYMVFEQGQRSYAYLLCRRRENLGH